MLLRSLSGFAEVALTMGPHAGHLTLLLAQTSHHLASEVLDSGQGALMALSLSWSTKPSVLTVLTVLD